MYTDKIKQDIGTKYWLGEFVQIHEIIDYGFVEYKPYIDISSKTKGFEAKSNFSIYIKRKGIGQSSDSIECAMAQAIAYRYDGPNTQAASFFMAMLSSADVILKDRTIKL